jgi:MFS family permease
MVGGPALTVCGLAGIAVSIGSASIGVLIALTVLVGMGVGFAMAHLMSWTILLATPGEESITASSIHTVRSLGFAIAAAIAGLIANIAGLGGGVSVSTVVAAVSGVAGIFALAPIAVVLLGVLLIRHRRRRPPVAAAGGEPASLSAAD